MQDNCSGTARLDIRKKSIESKAPHSHKSNDKSSMIKTLLYQEEENVLINIKKPKTEESGSGLDYEREEPNLNHDIDELSDSEKSSEFLNCDKISFIENSDFYAEDNCQIPLVGSNFTTTKSGKRIVFHHEGYNYNRTRISKKGTCVFLRLVISFL